MLIAFARNDTKGSPYMSSRRSETTDAISGHLLSKRSEIATLIAFARKDARGLSQHVFARRLKTDAAISGCLFSKKSEIAALITFARNDGIPNIVVRRTLYGVLRRRICLSSARTASL